MKKILFFIIFGILQADYLGGFAAGTIRYDSDARTQSLAGATLASPSTGFIQFANPASLHYIKRMVLGVSYFSLPLDCQRLVSSFSILFDVTSTVFATM